MLAVLKNTEGLIYAYCEYEVLNGQGQFEDDGEYLYIQDVWVHPSERFWGHLQELIQEVDKDKFTKASTKVYWCRHKYKERVKIFPKSRLIKFGGKYGKQTIFNTANT